MHVNSMKSALVVTVNRSARAETRVSKWINFCGSALCGLIFMHQLQTTKSTKIYTLTVRLTWTSPIMRQLALRGRQQAKIVYEISKMTAYISSFRNMTAHISSFKTNFSVKFSNFKISKSANVTLCKIP